MLTLQILVLSRKAFFDGLGIISFYAMKTMLPALGKCIVSVYSTTAEETYQIENHLRGSMNPRGLYCGILINNYNIKIIIIIITIIIIIGT